MYIKKKSSSSRLLLKVNENSGGFLEQHSAAGLLSPHIKTLYNKAIHGTGNMSFQFKIWGQG